MARQRAQPLRALCAAPRPRHMPRVCAPEQDELDELCEAFLDEKFDVRIDFAIEESMPRLRMYGLVDPMPDADDPRVKAPDLEVAHARLIKRWQRCGNPPPPPPPNVCLPSVMYRLRDRWHARFSACHKVLSNANRGMYSAARVIRISPRWSAALPPPLRS